MSDQYSANTLLLLHCIGDDNSNTFIDSSNKPKIVAPSGNAKISTAQSKYGGSAAYFDGSGDYLTVTSYGDNPYMFLGSMDLTFESWVFFTGYPNLFDGIYMETFISKRNSDFGGVDFSIYGTATSFTRLYFSIGTSSYYVNYSPPLNTWIHLAVCLNGSLLFFFADGTQIGTTKTLSSAITDQNVLLKIGKLDVTGYEYYFKGYLQDLRITRGIARYTEAFTPPPALLPNPDIIKVNDISQHSLRADINHGGRFRIADNVSRLGVMGRYLLALLDRRTKRVIRETWSAIDGSYAFDYLAYRYKGYTVIAFDHSGTPVNAAIGDFITPEPMPS